MTRKRRWIAGLAAVLAVLLAGLWALLHAWLPSDDQLAAQIGTRFEQTFGIGLAVGAAHWSLRPVPVIVLSQLATAQPRPITVRRIVLHPQLAALWRRELALDSVEVEGAVLPRASVRAFRGRMQWEDLRTAGEASGWRVAERPLQRLRLRDLMWIDRRDIALAYDGDIDFDAGWRPRRAEIRRADTSPPARLRLEREGDTDRWQTRIDAGGGGWSGVSTLEPQANGRLRLAAQLEAKNVDIESLMRAFGRATPVAGKMAGQTEVRAEGGDMAEWMRSLHTHTRFTVQPAELKRFDLAGAVRSAGTTRGGRTALDQLSGTLDTQLTDAGVVLQYSDLKARSGLLTASGRVRLFNRKLQGEAAVDLVDGVVGLPLQIAGTVEEPELSMTGGALAGAAIGSAVLPGVGTALGARLGQQVERLFDGDARQPASPARRQARP